MIKRTWNNLNIGKKFGAAVTLTIVLFIISTAIVSIQLNNVEDRIDAMERRAERSVNITDMISLFRAKDARIADYIVSEDDALLDEYENSREAFNELQETIAPKMETEKQQELFEQIKKKNQEANNYFLNQIVPAIKGGNDHGVQTFRDRTIALRSESNEMLNQLRGIVDEDREAAVQEAKTQADFAFWILIGSIVASVLLGGLVVLLVSRLVSRNLKKVVDISNNVAEGNLAVETLSYQSKDEIGQIAAGVDTMVEGLRETVYQIQDISELVSSQSEELTQSSQEVSSGAEQISSTMEELSSGAEEQAGSSNEISSIMTELNEQINESNEESRELEEASKEVGAKSQEGKNQMEQSVSQMNHITTLVHDTSKKVKGLEHRSQEISKLIEVIEDIAEQTNLLALNAAIEAARAGESGKGFAVVAEEVRKLAEQVSNSVSDITGIIHGIQTETNAVVQSLETGAGTVDEGSRQIQASREHFETINEAISAMQDRIQTVASNLSNVASYSVKVRESGSEIASTSEETSAGIEQVSATAQQQTSSMQEVAGSAESLSKMAEELNTLTKKFRL
ncbi:methyl-accepting chemotaxis protein [Salibacterium aidingense]|uniref:methyl-accepting chemotaxis protein n=1 Tax=Salibacterium aidingense TaxID=384933 RepID=UPI003BD5AC05